MPSLSELQRAKQSGLVNAIRKHGGIYAVAERLGLQLASTAKPPSYWDNIEHIKLAICEFNEMRGTPGVMPTGGELKKAGRTDLASTWRLKYFCSKMRPRKKKAEAINGQYMAPNREGHKLVVTRMLLWSDTTYSSRRMKSA
jgi:hypothetical protein